MARDTKLDRDVAIKVRQPWVAAIVLVVVIASATAANAQRADRTVEEHIAIARAAAYRPGQDLIDVFETLCRAAMSEEGPGSRAFRLRRRWPSDEFRHGRNGMQRQERCSTISTTSAAQTIRYGLYDIRRHYCRRYRLRLQH